VEAEPQRLKARARARPVELKRISSTLTVWPGEFIDWAALHETPWETGLPMGSFPAFPPVTGLTQAITTSRETAGRLAITAPCTDSTGWPHLVGKRSGQDSSRPHQPIRLRNRPASGLRLRILGSLSAPPSWPKPFGVAMAQVN